VPPNGRPLSGRRQEAYHERATAGNPRGGGAQRDHENLWETPVFSPRKVMENG
jgi:hypothetical protein